MEDIVLKIQQGNKELYTELWEDLRDLIAWYANRYYAAISSSGKTLGGVEREDLKQAGFIAITEAVKYYDPEKGSFKAILAYYIKKAFRETIGRSDRQLRDPLNYAISLNVPVSDDEPDEPEKLDCVPDPRDEISNVDDAVFTEQLHAALEKALDSISPREAYVIRSEFWEGCKQWETAEKMGISYQMVRWLKTDGFRNIRKSAAGKQLERFLDAETSFYSGVGIAAFKKTQKRAIESKVIHREELRKQYERLFKDEQRYKDSK